MVAHIINIGDELLIGDTVNTNASWMSRRLDGIGVEVRKVTVVGDGEKAILSALNDALNETDIILFTGGLGPTHDDITKHCLCKYFGDELVLNEEVLDDITRLLARFGRTVNTLNQSQAMVPSQCRIIRNSAGTAPGMMFRKGGKIIVSMPGVPHEMKKMMDDSVLPEIQSMSDGNVRINRHLRSFGIAEASLAEKLSGAIKTIDPKIRLAFLPSPGHVDLRFSASGNKREELNQILEKTINQFVPLIADYLYGKDDDTLETVTGRLLKSSKKTLVTAESCTGGKLASKITSIPGSSEYYKGSVIAYSNKIKTDFLSVPSDLIKKHGAVSEEVVKSMAEGARLAFSADYALATSGIAGPDGGTVEKPVGTIYVSLAGPKETKVVKLQLGFGRKINIEMTADHALNLLRKELQ